ncbi:hypothetical protein NDU88_007285 [Pleurodeles waltl]|uniref:Uncharacterized protein n=1 Tax=Pleurodeles waltl TaxID=8319 RepID=A0AAV7N1M3_PLEWA|nr:hypothetical protein NDU88_007285 [Pleurodeles waltl]
MLTRRPPSRRSVLAGVGLDAELSYLFQPDYVAQWWIVTASNPQDLFQGTAFKMRQRKDRMMASKARKRRVRTDRKDAKNTGESERDVAVADKEKQQAA